MLQISNLHVKLTDSDKEILHGVDLSIRPGEVHVLHGRNGSGKSTLGAVLSGHPGYEVTDGTVVLEGEDYPEFIATKLDAGERAVSLLDLEPDQRSLAGVFLANQYPLEIPGVNLSNFLRLAYNARQEQPLPVFKFRKLLKERAAIINYPQALLERNLNEGFSGGEKKKTEILQMAVLEPRYAILDETDSGLDKHAIVEVFEGIQRLRSEVLPNLSLLIITHYDRVFDFLKPDFEHEMREGRIA